MEQPTHVDLTESSFDEFVSFLFDRSIPATKPEKRDPWYWHVEVEFDAKKICAYYGQLFQQPEFLLPRFTKPQLETGIVGIESESAAARIWNCRMYISRH